MQWHYLGDGLDPLKDTSARYLVIYANTTGASQTLSGGKIYPSDLVADDPTDYATIGVSIHDPGGASPQLDVLTVSTAATPWSGYDFVTMTLAGGTPKTIAAGHMITYAIGKNGAGVILPPFLFAFDVA